MLKTLRALVAAVALAGLCIASPASAVPLPVPAGVEVLTVECVWKRGRYLVTRVDHAGSIVALPSVGDRCAEAITSFVNENSTFIVGDQVRGPSTALGHHTYVLVLLAAPA